MTARIEFSVGLVAGLRAEREVTAACEEAMGDDLSRKFLFDDYEEYGDTRYAADEYDEEFDFLGWHFHFWGDVNGDTPRYGATMSRDGETWECDYDCMFGAGFDDIH